MINYDIKYVLFYTTTSFETHSNLEFWDPQRQIYILSENMTFKQLAKSTSFQYITLRQLAKSTSFPKYDF